jgi:hypothetical protein
MFKHPTTPETKKPSASKVTILKGVSSTNSNTKQGGPHQRIYDNEGPTGDAAAPPA